MRERVDGLKVQLQEELPGRPAQFEMTNIHRDINYTVPEDARHAGVMLLLFPQEGQLYTTFIQRTAHNPNDPHSGQVSFPGGKRDETDENMLECALRETEEEIGVSVREIEVLGSLTQLYIPVSHFNVHPFVPRKPGFRLQESEVKSVLNFPLEHFLNEGNLDRCDITVRSFTMRNVPYFRAGDSKIWGATAMILNEFLSVWRKIS
jgi:8-oxo-dGTP pyrophosphatase MutT (NUDIX family)